MAASVSIEGTASLRVPLSCLFHHNPQRTCSDPVEPNFFNPSEFVETGSTGEAHSMAPISASEAFLTVAVMSATFLLEVGFFALIGIF